jgi:hypothetical protein
MPRRSELETGLRALSTLSGDPRLTFESKHGPAQDVVDVAVTGTFLPNERVSATIVTRTGARVGPFHCAGSISLDFATLEEVRAFRNSPFGFTLRTAIPLPAHIARNQVARFEFSREPLTSVRIGDEDVAIKADDAIGPPRIWDVSCVLQDNQGTFVSAFPGSQSSIRMPMVYAIGADRLPPVFSYADLLHVETLFQHVVRNTAYYSREVWRSLTPEERVILLEPYTIGPPIPTVPSPLDEIPLLNCVTNQVLGFFGNSMILPFHVPPNDVELSTAAIQDALLTFHREGGPAARTSIALPTHGVLGEGILGRCNACEKIDLTRFWNWQDSPIEAADNPVGFPGATLGSKPATAPATLVPQGDITLIQGMTAPDSSTNLAGVLAAAAEPQLTADVTGAAQLADVMATTADQAAATQKAILDASSGFGAKLMAAYPALRQLKGEIDKQTNKTDEQKAAEKNAAGVAKLIENVKKLALYVGQGADDNARAERAKEVRKMLGIRPSELDAMQKADLAQALAPKELDSDDVKNGKKAILDDLSNWS